MFQNLLIIAAEIVVLAFAVVVVIDFVTGFPHSIQPAIQMELVLDTNVPVFEETWTLDSATYDYNCCCTIAIAPVPLAQTCSKLVSRQTRDLSPPTHKLGIRLTNFE